MTKKTKLLKEPKNNRKTFSKISKTQNPVCPNFKPYLNFLKPYQNPTIFFQKPH